MDIIVGGTDDEKSALTLNIFDSPTKLQQEIADSLHQLQDRYQMAQIRIVNDQDDPTPMDTCPGKVSTKSSSVVMSIST